MTYYIFFEGFLDWNKKSIIFFLLLAGVFIFLCSCASTAAPRKSHLYARLTDNSKYKLLPPENIENPIDSHQFVTALYGDRSYQFSAWVKADKKGIEMALMNILGATMGELSYREGAVSFSSSVFPRSVAGEFIVADFQLCFYDTPALREALERCGLSLDETETGRRILQGKTLIIEIEKRQNSVRLVNHLRGYSYTLEGYFE